MVDLTNSKLSFSVKVGNSGVRQGKLWIEDRFLIDRLEYLWMRHDPNQ